MRNHAHISRFTQLKLTIKSNKIEMKVLDFEKQENGKVTWILAEIDIVPDKAVVICSQDEFCDWLENKVGLSEYEQADYQDDGEGEYSKAKFIDWDSVLDDFLNVEFIEKYIKSNNVKVLP